MVFINIYLDILMLKGNYTNMESHEYSEENLNLLKKSVD